MIFTCSFDKYVIDSSGPNLYDDDDDDQNDANTAGPSVGGVHTKPKSAQQVLEISHLFSFIII